MSPQARRTISQQYHFVDRAQNRTACGIGLGHAYGMFVSLAHTYAQQIKLRCPECVSARGSR